MKTLHYHRLLSSFFVSGFLLLGIISGNKKDSTTTPTATPVGTFSATINGTTEGTWSVTCNSTAGAINISGTCNGYTLGMKLVDVTDTGIYQLGYSGNYQATALYQNIPYDAGILSSGTLHVTAINNSNKIISGTFKYGATSAYNVTLNVAGSFTNLTW